MKDEGRHSRPRGRHRKKMVKKLFLTLLCFGLILFAVPLWAADPFATAAASEGEAQVGSLEELNKELSNPVTSVWSIAFQQNNYVLEINGKRNHWNSNFSFQPVLPVALNKNCNLITRPVVTVFNSSPHPNPHNPSETKRTTGFGDTIWMEMFAPTPKLTGRWLFGIGPTFIFPTASSDFTGQGKWQVGPAVVMGYLWDKWILGAFVQNWTSFGGSGNRPDTNQMNLQPFAAHFMSGGWSIAYSGNILANWKANSAGDVWTVPLGVSVAKLMTFGPLPVRIGLSLQYMVHHPDNYGQQWNIQLGVTPIIPKLIKGTLFAE